MSLHHDGDDINTIAKKRDLKISTVYSHFAEAIEVGLLDAKEVLKLSEDQHKEIIAALEINEDEEGRLKSVFDALDGSYDYGILKCVQASF